MDDHPTTGLTLRALRSFWAFLAIAAVWAAVAVISVMAGDLEWQTTTPATNDQPATTKERSVPAVWPMALFGTIATASIVRSAIFRPPSVDATTSPPNRPTGPGNPHPTSTTPREPTTATNAAGAKRIFNTRSSVKQPGDKSLGDAYSEKHLDRGAQIRQQCDLTPPWQPQDQRNSGAGTALAVIDCVLRQQLSNSGTIRPDQPLSVRFAWMAAKEMDSDRDAPTTMLEQSGTSIRAVLDICKTFGAVPESACPPGGPLPTSDPDDFLRLAAKLQISDYFSLGTEPTAWRAWLDRHGPVAIRIVADETFLQCDPSQPTLNQYRAATRTGGHAVALVAYNEGHFTIRNSWGVGWGTNGQATATDDYLKAAATEAYGLLL